MNPIEQALSEGYSDEEVLAFITKRFPRLAENVAKAAGSGYNPKRILNYITPFFGKGGSRSQTSITSQQGVHAQKRQEDIKANQALMKQLAVTGATLGAGVLAGKALGSVAPKIGQILGKRVPAEAAEGASITKAVESPEYIKKLSTAFDLLKLSPKIESLLAHQTPEAIPGMLLKQISDEERGALEQGLGKDFAQLVQDYTKNYLEKAEKRPFGIEGLRKTFAEKDIENARGQPASLIRTEMVGKEQMQPAVEDTEQMRSLAEQLQPVSSQEMNPFHGPKSTILPSGQLGEIESEKQGIATIRMPDGKKRTQKVSDLEFLEPGIERQIGDLLESLPEEGKSAPLAFASYTPSSSLKVGGKELDSPFMVMQFHNGDMYVYPDVTKEQYDRIVSKATPAKTSGENAFHAWTKGEGSRGAGMREIITELEKEFGKNFIKFKASEGYDYFKLIRETGKKITKERQRRKKLAEKVP